MSILTINFGCNSKTNTESTTEITNASRTKDIECPFYIIEYSEHSKSQTDSFKIKFDNELDVSVGLLRNKFANLKAKDSLSSEILKIYANTSSAGIYYDTEFVQTHNLLVNHICGTLSLLQNPNLKQATKDKLESDFVLQVREFSDFRTGKKGSDTVQITITDTIKILQTKRDTVIVPRIEKVKEVNNPKFIGNYYITAVYASISLNKAKEHLAILRRKKYENSNVAWNRSNQMYQVYVGTYSQEKNANISLKKVRKIPYYGDAYVIRVKRYEKGIIEWKK